MGVVKALSAMNKGEIQAELDLYKIEYSRKDTIPELLPLLSAAREKRGVKTAGQVKRETQMGGISGLSKAELTSRMEDLGLPVKDGMTRNQMIYEIKGHIMANTPPQHDDKVEFGKHADLTYEQLRDQQPKYAEWVIQTMENIPTGETPYPRMVKLYRYLVQNPKGLPKKSETKVEKTDGTKVPVPESPRTTFTDTEEKMIQEAMRRIKAGLGGSTSSGSNEKDAEQRMSDQTKRAPPKTNTATEEPQMDLFRPSR